jgi:agmatinase
MLNAGLEPSRSFLEQDQSGLSSADVVFLGLPLDASSSYLSGAARAPEAIFRASCELEKWDLVLGLEPFEDLGQHSVLLGLENSIGAMSRDLSLIQKFAAAIPSESLVLGLGGNHSVTPALVRARMPEPGVVVHIDAHFDLRDTYEGSPYSHACPMRRVLEQGHRLIQIGIRSGAKEELQFARSQGDRVEYYLDHEWTPEVEGGCLRRLRGLAGPIYLSVDVDGLEPQLCPGTGTPQPGGLSWRSLCGIIGALLEAPQAEFKGADVVECVPMPSTALNESVAAAILFRIVAHYAKRRL